MGTFLLVAAMRQESQALLKLHKPWERVQVGSYRAYRTELAGRELLLVESGMGIQRAEAATRLALDRLSPQYIISIGIAGAVKADLKIGDVVMAERTAAWEKDAIGAFRELKPLPEAAWQAAATALEPRHARLVKGTVLTTGIAQPGKIDPKVQNPILEMETAGILNAAAKRGLPLISLRSISDNLEAPIPFDMGEIMDRDYNLRIGNLLGVILRRPKTLQQALKLARNSQIAAENAALAIAAALKEM